jgi:DNA helicase II / ATP-dependent DNA helicase PcrA
MTQRLNLNPQQSAAVTTTSRYVRIIAGAGSGKTRVLITRIVHLIEELGVPPSSILAITFTNKAANEMKERILRMLGDLGRGAHISTIHSLCVRILREDSMRMKLPRNFTVLDAEDQKSIVKEALKELNIDRQRYSLGHLLDYIGNNKGAEITPDRAVELAGNMFGEKEKARIYKYYVDKCNAQYFLDFDDLLLVTVKMFKMHPDCLSKWQRRFSFIHVDEFQDVDSVQYTLIKQLTGEHNSVYVVGDPDQTIYTWRGADVNIILNFERDFSPCETIVLSENYRSTPAILTGANSLIKNNKYRVDKDLFTNKAPAEVITHVSCPSEDQESAWIAQKVKQLHNEGKSYMDMAILYRSNYISRALEKGLRDFHIPYVIYGGVRFYDRLEVKDTLSYLRMITHNDDLAFLRIINQPRRGIGDKTLEVIRTGARQKDMTMYEFIKMGPLFSGKVQKTIDDFIAMIEKWKSKTEHMTLDKVLEMVLDDSGIRAMLQENNETDRIENLKELINDIMDFIDRYPEADLTEYLQMVSLYGDKAEVLQGEFIQLMTVHAAKGLEFDTVILASMSEGVFPNERSISEGRQGIEEERRLAYVAMTRAKQKLYLTESQGFSYVLSRPKTRSRFIAEIDEKTIEHIGLSSGEKKERNLSAITILSGDDVRDRLTKKEAIKIKKGDIVVHVAFGEGVVIAIQEDLAEIAFNFPHGIKRIVASHPSLSKKGGVS